MGGLEFVAAGQFEGAVEGSQAAAGVLEGGGADAADLAPGVGDCGQGKVSKTDSVRRCEPV